MNITERQRRFVVDLVVAAVSLVVGLVVLIFALCDTASSPTPVSYALVVGVALFTEIPAARAASA